MVYIFFLIITELIKPCTIHSGRNYTILNVVWQSNGPGNVKYWEKYWGKWHLISRALRGRTGMKGVNKSE